MKFQENSHGDLPLVHVVVGELYAALHWRPHFPFGTQGELKRVFHFGTTSLCQARVDFVKCVAELSQQ